MISRSKIRRSRARSLDPCYNSAKWDLRPSTKPVSENSGLTSSLSGEMSRATRTVQAGVNGRAPKKCPTQGVVDADGDVGSSEQALTLISRLTFPLCGSFQLPEPKTNSYCDDHNGCDNKNHHFVSAICCFNASFILLCQPLPWLLKCSITSGDKRRVVDIFVGVFCEPRSPRLRFTPTTVRLPSSTETVSIGSSVKRLCSSGFMSFNRLPRLKSSSVSSGMSSRSSSGLLASALFVINSSLLWRSFAKRNDANTLVGDCVTDCMQQVIKRCQCEKPLLVIAETIVWNGVISRPIQIGDAHKTNAMFGDICFVFGLVVGYFHKFIVVTNKYNVNSDSYLTVTTNEVVSVLTDGKTFASLIPSCKSEATPHCVAGIDRLKSKSAKVGAQSSAFFCGPTVIGGRHGALRRAEFSLLGRSTCVACHHSFDRVDGRFSSSKRIATMATATPTRTTEPSTAHTATTKPQASFCSSGDQVWLKVHPHTFIPEFDGTFTVPVFYPICKLAQCGIETGDSDRQKVLKVNQWISANGWQSPLEASV